MARKKYIPLKEKALQYYPKSDDSHADFLHLVSREAYNKGVHDSVEDIKDLKFRILILRLKYAKSEDAYNALQDVLDYVNNIIDNNK